VSNTTSVTCHCTQIGVPLIVLDELSAETDCESSGLHELRIVHVVSLATTLSSDAHECRFSRRNKRAGYLSQVGALLHIAKVHVSPEPYEGQEQYAATVCLLIESRCNRSTEHTGTAIELLASLNRRSL